MELMTKLTLDQIARIAHEVNRQYILGLQDHSLVPGRPLGGIHVAAGKIPVPPTWEEAPEAQREGLRQGVRFVLDNPTAGPGEQHQNWLTRKIQLGWRYGHQKDEIRMEHPNLVPFDQLPATERAKDFLFRAIVTQLAGLEDDAKLLESAWGIIANAQGGNWNAPTGAGEVFDAGWREAAAKWRDEYHLTIKPATQPDGPELGEVKGP